MPQQDQHPPQTPLGSAPADLAQPDSTRPVLSLVAPAHNEQENIQALVDQSGRALHQAVGHGRYELIVVDDGSTDATRATLAALAAVYPWLRPLAMTSTPPGRGNGQSAAFHAGIRACRADLVATIDADLQNDPADLAAMLDLMRRTDADLVQGDRSRARADNAIRKLTSLIGRLFRRLLLGDTVRDTGCSLRIIKRHVALQLPLQFRGMHRFIPVTAANLGYKVVEMPVAHRPRIAGTTKYGLGIWQRALPGLIDCFAVRWMRSRRRPVSSVPVEPRP